MIDSELLELLACPSCKAQLSTKDNGLHCNNCSSSYPVVEGVPRFL